MTAADKLLFIESTYQKCVESFIKFILHFSDWILSECSFYLE